MEKITIKVSFPAWSVAEKSWYLLTQKQGAGWTGGSWFPRSLCTLEEDGNGDGALTLPNWLLRKKQADGVIFTFYDNEI